MANLCRITLLVKSNITSNTKFDETTDIFPTKTGLGKHGFHTGDLAGFEYVKTNVTIRSLIIIGYTVCVSTQKLTELTNEMPIVG